MDYRTKLQARQLIARCSTAALFFVCLSYSLPAFAETGARAKLTELETNIVGTVSKNLPIEKRISKLELKVFSKVQAGSLNSRINALEKFAGSSSSEFMPPIPPQYARAYLK